MGIHTGRYGGNPYSEKGNELTQAESILKNKLKQYIESRGGFWSAIPEDAPGAKPGDPDMIVCYRGRFIGCEGKIRTKQRPLQVRRQEEITSAGGIYRLIHSIEEIELVFSEIDHDIDG